MRVDCLLTHTSKRRNRSQEQALPTPAMKTVPVRGKMPNSLLGRGSLTAMPDMAQNVINDVIMAIPFLPVSWRMWALPVLCSSGVPCRKVQGSQGRGWMAAHWGRQNPDSSGVTALRATHHPQRDVCPMFQTSLGHQWLYRICTMVLLS